MMGRKRDQDTWRPGIGAMTDMGADVLFRTPVARAYISNNTGANPRNAVLKVSNKPSEHNISKMPIVLVVRNMGAPTRPRLTNRILSRRVVLRTGNQSLGGT